MSSKGEQHIDDGRNIGKSTYDLLQSPRIPRARKSELWAEFEWISLENDTPTPRIPAIITGMENLIMLSGLRIDVAAIPTADLAVP